MFISCVSCIADRFFTAELLSPLKEKEEKIHFLKIGALLEDLLMKDRHVLECLLDWGLYFLHLKKIVVKYITKFAIEPFLII